MRIPLSWLNEYVTITDIPVDELRRRLDLAGLEVETVEVIGHPGAELPWAPDKVLTAEVRSVRPHPDADRLVLAEVEYGGSEPEVVVTGAPSLYRRRGESDLHLKVAFAWKGAVLFDGHSEGWTKRKLKETQIRGVRSRAMVCSEKELGLAEEQTDIIYLPDDTPVGIPLVEVLGDYIFNFDIKGPFGHLQSVYGVAREVAALLDRPCSRTPLEAVTRLGMLARAHPEFVDLEIRDPDLCPRYTAAMIRGVRVGPSPLWMQMRLRRAGMRPINNIVDITNYVMLELGEPLHAFDYAQLRGISPDRPAIIVRRAAEGETMVTLDKVERTFDGEMLLITDGGGPVAVAGVMGGLHSEVAPDTEVILLEAANFTFTNIRRTSQTLKLFTESAARFGKRVDSELTLTAAARAAEFMASLAGGKVSSSVADLYPGRPQPVTLTYQPALADRILGVTISPEEQAHILKSLEFEIVPQEGSWAVQVPSYRLDVRRPVDLVEEVARIWGYDRFPHTLIAEPLPPLHKNEALIGEERVRDLLTSLGLDEVITYSLLDPQDETRLAPAADVPLSLPGDPVSLQNPLAPERSQMRRTLLPGMLRTAWSNLRYLDRVAIFEVGRIYYADGQPDVAQAKTGVNEPRYLGALLTGPRQSRWWQPQDRSPMDYFDLKGLAEATLRSLGVCDETQWRRAVHPSFHPGRCAEILLHGKSLGVIGELHPLVREAFDLPEQPLVLLEWNLETLLAAVGAVDPARRMRLISNYPPVHEDLALVVDEEIPALDVQRAILKAGYPLVTRALLFDVYRGPQIAAEKKSLTFALSYQAPDKQLSDKNINSLRRRILKQVQKRFGATLRA